MAGNSGTSETPGDPEEGCGEARQRTEAAAGTAEMGAPEQPPVARGGPSRQAATRKEEGGDGGAAVVGPALRFALNAPPFGLRRATLRAGPTTKKEPETKPKKGTLLTR